MNGGPDDSLAAGPPAGGAVQRPGRGQQGSRVLLAEDDASSAELATELLRDAGLAVDHARDGLEAVTMAAAAAYDLVLMDVQMPRLDGLQATRAIRVLPGWQRRPIIALTASALPDQRMQCLEAGMDDFIAKPLKPDNLHQLLRRWVGGAPEAAPRRTPSPGDADRILASLAVLPDMDREHVLSFRGKAPRYLGLLRDLLAQHAGDMALVAGHLRDGDTAAARQLTHALRGNAAMLGAARLVRAAEQLEILLLQDEAAPQADLVAPEIDGIGAALATLAAALDGAPRASPAAPA